MTETPNIVVRDTESIVTSLEPLALQQFITLVTSGMPLSCLTGYLQCTDEECTAVLNHPTIVKEVTASRNKAQLTAVQTNDSWDNVERKALKQITNYLTKGDDPEYAIRAAHIANKALRRKADEKANTADDNVGHTVVLNLNNNIINHLQAPTQIATITNNSSNDSTLSSVPKRHDVFQARQLNDLLGVNLAHISPVMGTTQLIEPKADEIEINWSEANE